MSNNDSLQLHCQCNVTDQAAERIYAYMNEIQPLNLTRFCRDSDKLITTVEIEINYRRTPWLTLGQCDIMPRKEASIWTLQAYLDNCTDGEHDSSKIVSLEVVGLQYKFTAYGISHFEGWIRGDEPDMFRVPTVDYDPLKDATKCKQCKGEDAHLFAEFMPPQNDELYDIVRGKKIAISTGMKHKE